MGPSQSSSHTHIPPSRVTRIWKIPFNNKAKNVKIDLKQETFRENMSKLQTTWVILRQEEIAKSGQNKSGDGDTWGEFRIYVDGLRIVTIKSESHHTEHMVKTPVPLPDGTRAEIIIEKNTSWIDIAWKFRYRLVINGEEQLELNDIKNTLIDPLFFTASVTSFQMAHDVDGDDTGFEITTIKTGDSRRFSIVRKYADFQLLYECWRWFWYYHNHFSLETIPKVPILPNNSLSKIHLDQDDLRTYQHNLDNFLKSLLRLPQASANPDVLAFLGLTSPLDDIPLSKTDNGAENNSHATPKSVGTEVDLTLDDFESILRSLGQEALERMADGPSTVSQEQVGQLVSESSLETILKGVFTINDVNSLIRGFSRCRQGKKQIAQEEFQAWCDSQLPSIPDLLQARVKQLTLKVEPKRPFPPSLDAESKVITPSSLRFLTVAFTECYSAPTWNRLYASFADGLSFQTLCKALEGYEGPTLIITQDSFGARFGALATGKWREETNFFSSISGAVFSLEPTFYVYRRKMLTSKPKSKNVQYMNSRSRTLPLGLGLGGELHSRNASESAPHPRIWIDSEFDTCFATSGRNDDVFEPGPLLGDDLTRETFLISHLEAWGLGGEDAMQARTVWRGQKDRMIQKQRQVDKSQFANNGFDREYLLKDTFSGHSRETNNN